MPKRRTMRKTRKPRTRKSKSYQRPNRRVKSNNPKIENRHYAQITETLQRVDAVSNNNTQEYFTLGDFPRAWSLATNFKFYRAKKVMYKYEPIYNVYGEGATTDTVPYMYTIMNRDQGNNQGLTIADFQKMGAIPQKFTSSKTIQYTPNWVAPGLQAFKTVRLATGENVVNDVVSQGTTKHYGYLATPDESVNIYSQNNIIETAGMITQGYQKTKAVEAQVIYNGHNVYFQQNDAGTLANVAKRTLTVVWEFRGPKVKIPQLQESNVTVQV